MKSTPSLVLQIRPSSDFRALSDRPRPNSGSADFQYFEEVATRRLWIGKSSNQAISLPQARHPLYQAYYEEYKEWLGYAMYRLFDIPLPEFCLSLQLPKKVSEPVEGFNYRDPHLHVMSQFIDGFSPLGANFLEAYKQQAAQQKPPQIALPDGAALPLQGLGATLAVACFLYDGDCLGGGGGNMGYIVKEQRGQKVAQVFKIDPGCAFSFLENYEEKEYRHDPRRRNIRFSPQRPSVIHYHELTSQDQTEFTQTARRILKTPPETFKQLIDQVVNREGFTRKQADTLFSQLLARKSTFLTGFAPEVSQLLQEEILQAKEAYLQRGPASGQSWQASLTDTLELERARAAADLADASLRGQRPTDWHYQLPEVTAHFVERGDLLHRLAQQLHDTQASVVTQGIQGLGGVGKTQLAARYVQLAKTRQRLQNRVLNYQVIIWFRAETLLNLQFQTLAELWCNQPKLSGPQAVTCLYRWLEDKSSLIVFDNIESPESLTPFLPPSSSSLLSFLRNRRAPLHLLLTSRHPRWEVPLLTLGEFSASEARRYIKEHIPSAQEEEMQTLLQTITALPLALAHATAYIQAGNCSLADYPRHFTAHQLRLGNRRTGISETILTTFLLSATRLEERFPGALFLSRLAAFLSPEPIPLAILDFAWKDKGYQPTAFLPTLKALLDYNLLQGDRSMPHMHRLVQKVLQESLEAKTQIEWIENVCLWSIEAYPKEGYGLQIDAIRKAFIPHFEQVIAQHKTYSLPESPILALTILLLGNLYLNEIGDVKQACQLLEQSLVTIEKHFGPEHPTLASNLTSLGNAYGVLGNPNQRRCLLERALVIFEKNSGPEHPTVASTLANLGSAYGDLGDSAQQLKLLERALAIEEKHFGTGHPEITTTLVILGNAYGDLGDLNQKRKLLERALAIQEKHFGPEHPTLATTLMNLGNAYSDLDNSKQKRLLLERALAIQEKHLGPDHPELAKTLINISKAYGDLGDNKKACQLSEKALSIFEKHFGPEHPNVAIILTNLAIANHHLGHPQQALTLAERAYQIVLHHPDYGPQHPLSKDILGKLSTFKKQTPSRTSPPNHGISSSEPSVRSSPEEARLVLSQATVKFVDDLEDHLQTLERPFDPQAAASFVEGVLSAFSKGEEAYRFLLAEPLQHSIPLEVAAFIRRYIPEQNPILMHFLEEKELAQELRKILYTSRLEELRQQYGLVPVRREKQGGCSLM